MSFRFRAWPWECIIALKKELDYALHLYMTRDGDTIHTQRRKYSNPDNHRSPIIKCPLCGKNLYAVFNAQVKNDCIPFDADDPKYWELEYEYKIRCSRCHHFIGILVLDARKRKKLGLPYQNEMHSKLSIDQILESKQRLAR